MKLDWRVPIFLTAALFGLFGSTGFSDANAPFETVDVAQSVANPGVVPTVMELDSENRPAILYFEDDAGPSPTTGDIRLYRCADMNCDAGLDIEIAAGVSRQISLGMTLDVQGFPVIVYWTVFDTQVHVIRCQDLDCTGTKSDHLVPGKAQGTKQVIDVELSGDLPAMVLNIPPDVSFVRCLLPDCSTGIEAYTLPSIGSQPQLEINSSGFPVITLQSFIINEGFEIFFCDDPVCEGPNEASVFLETDTSLGYSPSLILDEQDRPRVAYGNTLSSLLKLAICADAACGGTTIYRTLATGTLAHFGNGIALRDGKPIIAFSRNTSGSLATRILRCDDPTCATSSVSDADGPYATQNNLEPALFFDAHDGYFISFFSVANSSVRLLRADPSAFDSTPGDVDCTGGWTATDALIILRALAGLTGAPEQVSPCSTDVDGVPGTTLADAIFARQQAAGLN